MIGAGSWGTALALQFARNGREVRLWGRNSEQLERIKAAGENERYLPGATFPQHLHPTPDLRDCLEGVTDILISVPSRYMHSPVEVVSLKDVERTGRLMAYFIAGLDDTFIETLIP